MIRSELCCYYITLFPESQEHGVDSRNRLLFAGELIIMSSFLSVEETVMNKKTVAVLALCILCAVMFAGCSIIEVDPSSYTKMETVDPSAYTLAEAANEQVSVSYDSENWVQEESAALLTLILEETKDDANMVNISLQVSAEYEGPFTNNDRKALYRTFSSYGYISFDAFELRRIENDIIIYMEMTTKFTDKNIDSMLEKGLLTEEAMESVGGRDYLLSMPTTYQTMIYAIRDGRICVYTGTCYSKEHKQLLQDQMLLMIGSTEVLAAPEA